MENLESDRIVVGVDGSESSVAALRYAARMSVALGVALEAVTSWSAPPMYYAGGEWYPEQDAQDALDDAVKEAFGATPPARLTRSVIPGSPAHALIEMSKSSGMLVLGSRGRGGFTGLLLGSVSAACARHAHCPVLIVRAQPTDAEAVSSDRQDS